jgi:hypothetical protein
MKLTDSFEDVDIPDMLELKVYVYNINQGRNKEILQKSKSLRDYAAFIGRVKENRAEGLALAEAIKEAVGYCIDNDIMKDYLKNNAELRSAPPLTVFATLSVLPAALKRGAKRQRIGGGEHAVYGIQH